MNTGRDNSVSAMARLHSGRRIFGSRRRSNTFLFANSSRPVMGPIQNTN